MNETNRKKFLLKMSDESQYRIFSKNSGICILKSSADSRWSDVAFIKNMHPCFYADIDNSDSIHIVSQDLSGSIIYSKIEKNLLTSRKVLEGTSANVFDRRFFMLFQNSDPVFFYTVHQHFETMLVGQCISGKNASTPIPLYKVPDTKNPYWIAQIRQNTGLIIFPVVSGSYTQICASIIRLDTLRIISEKVITSEESNCESPKCIILADGSIHMLFSIRKNGKFLLKYQKGSTQALDCSKAEIIAVSRQVFTKYNMEYSSDTLNINWLESGYIYFRSKKLSESDFSQIQSYKSYRLRFIEYYHCKFNFKSRKIHCFSTEQPLCFEGKIQYAFYRESENNTVPLKDEKKPEPKKTAYSTPEAGIFRALSDYLSSREDISDVQQNKIQKMGDVIIELSKLLNKSKQRNFNKESNKKIKPQKTYHLRKPIVSHTYKIKK